VDRLPFEACEPFYQALGLEFHPEQLDIVKSRDRFPVIGGGERGGKTFTTAAILLPHIVLLPYIRKERFFKPDGSPAIDLDREAPRNPDFLLFGPTYAEPRQEFQHLEDWLRRLGKLPDGRKHMSKPQDGPWRLVTTDGVVVATWSMEDPTSIRSVNLEGAACCEAGKMPYSGVERVWGRVSATKGFIVYSGTMESSQKWYEDWMLMGKRPNHLGIKSYSLPSYTNRHQFPGGYDDPEIQHLKRVYSEDVFAMRVLAEPRPPRDRVLKEVTTDHIGELAVPEDALVEIWVDPGYASAYAVLFVAMWDEYERDRDGQLVRDDEGRPRPLGRRFYVFDELYEQGKTTDDIIDLCQQHPAWPRIRSGVIDVAAKGHRDAGESALEKWQLRTPLTWNMRYWPEAALIERIRSSAKQGRITINPKCRGLIAECGLGEPVFPEMHPWKFHTDRDGRITSERPVDKWNHSAKALGYGLLHHLGQVESLRRPRGFNRLEGEATPWTRLPDPRRAKFLERWA
jgi:hypothetical protein